MSGNKNVPFRKWFGCLGEIRSLIPKRNKLIIVTATATKATKSQIFESLDIVVDQLYTVEQNPNRSNLMYMLSYMDKQMSLKDVFAKLIVELQTTSCKTERTLIYCQTRKQCSLLFRMFEMNLGKKMYKGPAIPLNRLVEMFHAGTPQSVKDHVIKNMTVTGSHLRVLIATVAFGMGVNCKEVRHVIHFGPSKNLEQYVQESGRAGRDGKVSTCTLLYNGLLATYCEKDMKEFLQSDRCRRQELMRNFNNYVCIEFNPAHNCCDVCASNCDCNSPECGMSWCVLVPESAREIDDLCMATTSKSNIPTRHVNEYHKQEIIQKLLYFQRKLGNRLHAKKSVSCPNMLMEFNKFHINQVVSNCHLLFCLDDVLDRIEIWRNQYAYVILQTIADVFRDIEYNYPDADFSTENMSILDESINSIWSELRSDSSFNRTFESLNITCEDTANDCTDMSDTESNYSSNNSLFQMLVD